MCRVSIGILTTDLFYTRRWGYIITSCQRRRQTHMTFPGGDKLPQVIFQLHFYSSIYLAPFPHDVDSLLLVIRGHLIVNVFEKSNLHLSSIVSSENITHIMDFDLHLYLMQTASSACANTHIWKL